MNKMILAIIAGLFSINVMATPHAQPVEIEIEKSLLKAKIESNLAKEFSDFKLDKKTIEKQFNLSKK